MATARDPFEFVVDAPLFVVPRTLERLRAYRDGAKLADLPGTNPSPERERLAVVLDDLSTRLLAGIEAHPTKFWVLKQFQESLELVKDEDTEAREHFGEELERLMEILGIGSSDGVLTHYLGSPGS
jgi:hypothetical protein